MCHPGSAGRIAGTQRMYWRAHGGTAFGDQGGGAWGVGRGAIMRGGNAEAAAMLLPRTRNDARRVMEALMSPKAPRVPDFVLDDFVSRAPASPLSRLANAPLSTFEEWLLDDKLHEIATPVVLIWGADDRLIPLHYAEQARARLPHATLETIPDCGHVPQRECPAALLPLLQAAISPK